MLQEDKLDVANEAEVAGKKLIALITGVTRTFYKIEDIGSSEAKAHMRAMLMA